MIRKTLRPFSLFVILAVLGAAVPRSAFCETWAEKLGYPAGKRVLILHADDIGMCFEANQAAKHYLAAGEIQSAAMMMPCPWVTEFAAWYKEHPEHDCGLHLAMNAEWKHYRWLPVAPREKVPSLVDKLGFMLDDTPKTVLVSKPEHVEIEVRAQIEKALALGIKPSHVDTHMGTLYGRPAFTAAYMKAAQEYRIPAMVIESTPKIIDKFRKRGMPVNDEMQRLHAEYKLPKLDDFDAVAEGKTYEEKRDNFFKQIKSLDPGINELIFHPSVESEALRHITGSAQQRIWEAQIFSDPAVKEFLKSEGIVFTNWKEMMARWKERCPDKVKQLDELYPQAQ